MTAPAHPAPEIVARSANADEINLAAGRIVKLAEANGWTTRAMYARGTGIGANGKPTKIGAMLVVTCRRPGQQLAAIWRDGAFMSAVTPSLERLNSVQLKERLSS